MTYLRYDNFGLRSEAISEHGIDPAAREELHGRVQDGLDALEQARQNKTLGFLDCPDYDVESIVAWAQKRRQEDFTDQVVIGIGGSSLGARAVLAAAGKLDGLRTHFTENIDPVGVVALFEELDLARTLFVVVTKSGSTIETMSKFWYAWDAVLEKVGADEAGRHFVAITDPEKGSLRELAEQYGFDTFEVPPNVGGRFSVLTPVGLVPLALAGYPIDRLLTGARGARDAATRPVAEGNPVAQAAADQYLLYRKGYVQTVMMAYSDELYPLVDWFCQLWGESLGKATNRQGERVNVGMTPVKALGVIDQHSQVQLYIEGPRDKNIVFLEVDEFSADLQIPAREGLPESLSHLSGRSLSELLHAELRGTRHALQDAKRPTSSWIFPSITPEGVGAFIFSWEFITALMGELLDINAFDQPGVELGKKIAHGLLGRPGFEEYGEVARQNARDRSQADEIC